MTKWFSKLAGLARLIVRLEATDRDHGKLCFSGLSWQPFFNHMVNYVGFLSFKIAKAWNSYQLLSVVFFPVHGTCRRKIYFFGLTTLCFSQSFDVAHFPSHKFALSFRISQRFPFNYLKSWSRFQRWQI